MEQTRYQQWLQHPNTDPSLREQLKQMGEQEAQDCFYTNVEFGTGGMRGLLGPGPNRINIHTIRKANQAFAQYIISAGEEAMNQGVAIAYDNRHFSREFAFESARVLAMNNIRSYVFSSLRPTPELSFAVRELKCFGGIVMTASHNPKEYNGYKLYDALGCQLIPAYSDQVIAYANAIEDELAIVVSLSEKQEQLIQVIDVEIDVPYVEAVKGIQLLPNEEKTISIVFTPQHGTSRQSVEQVFQDCGYHYVLVEEQAQPDPDFSNTKTPNPEESASYELALTYARRHNADIILTTDPDADRVGVVVHHQGEYILMSGNQTGAVLIEYVLSQRKAQKIMPKHPVMFNTVVTSDLGEKIADSYGVAVEKTLTGFKFIGEKIHQHELLDDKQFVFGYEESYGYLVAPFVRDKDAIQACLIIAEAANYYKKQGKTLFDVLQELYQTHGFYEESQVALSLAGEAGAKRIVEITSGLRNNKPATIGGQVVIGWEDYLHLTSEKNGTMGTLDFPVSDVLKFYLADGSWIAIRPSGTEPKCKFYFCVAGMDHPEVLAKTKVLQEAMQALIA